MSQEKGITRQEYDQNRKQEWRTEETCGTCVYAWYSHNEWYRCKRYPPTSVEDAESMDTGFTFVYVPGFEWCGEYKNRDKERKKEAKLQKRCDTD